ncbi:MAG: hypothetical protein KH009_07820 [Clostridiales bacterium]|nr:hypothetical protein [Clostridiales bacterium]
MKINLLIAAGIAVCLCFSACTNGANPSGAEGPYRSTAGNLAGMEQDSPPSANGLDPTDSMAELEENAKLLTEQIVLSVFSVSNLYETMTTPPEDLALDRFALSTLLYLDHDQYRYREVFVSGGDGYYHIPKEKLQWEISEVFGIEDWAFTDQSGVIYNEQSKTYSILSGFGIGNGLECKNLTVSIDTENNRALVQYDLYTSSEFPDSKLIGPCTTSFSIRADENGGQYLRYIKSEIQEKMEDIFA